MKFKKTSIKKIPIPNRKIRGKGMLRYWCRGDTTKKSGMYRRKKDKYVPVIRIKLSRIKWKIITSRDFIFEDLFWVLRKQRAANKGEKYISFSSKSFAIFGLLMVSTIEENLNYSLVLGFNVIVITELG